MKFTSALKPAFAILILSVLSSASMISQQRISGTVFDAGTGEALQFANVWVKDSHSGTTTDRDGRFTLILSEGSNTLVASYMGYRSQTRSMQIPGEADIAFRLSQISIEMPTVDFTPGDNPALRIIRRAIEAKERRAERLDNFSLTSHSKLSVRVSGALESMVESSGSSLTISASVSNEDDTSSTPNDSIGNHLPILLESQTEAWWAKPDRYKEVIKARKQSAMIPSQANIMISAFFIVDFSADELTMGKGVPLPGPISERGLDTYYYRLLGETVLDDTKIYMIELSPLYENDPGFEGMIYISDSSYSMSMVDLHVNEAAMPRFFSSLSFKQHFQRFEGDFWMPVDVVVDADIDINIAVVDMQIDIDGFSVLQDYRINQQINEDFFDRTRIKVLKEADERDSTYWLANQKIPNTLEEKRAYLKADTVKMEMDSVRYLFDPWDVLSGGTTGSDEAQLTFPGLISLYRYNRVEGHALDGDFRLSLPEQPLRVLSAGGGYGFDDERFKYRIGAWAAFFSSPTLWLGAERHYERDFIDSGTDPAGETMVTLFNLLARYDYRDYFYRDGWSASLSYDPFMLFPISVRYAEDRFFNAHTVGDWSIFSTDKEYRSNPPVNEGSIRTVSGTLEFDNRYFIDNAGEIRRIGARNHVPTLLAGWHDLDIAGSQWDIFTLGARLTGRFNLNLYGETSYRLSGDYADDALPTQLLYNLQGSMNWLTWPDRFRTLGFREFGGDRRVTAYFSHNFRDWLFRAAHLPFLKDSGWALKLFAAGGWTQMSPESAALQTVDVRETGPVFWEAGFAIDNIFSFFRIDLAWRLNHFREGENFYIGIGTTIF